MHQKKNKRTQIIDKIEREEKLVSHTPAKNPPPPSPPFLFPSFMPDTTTTTHTPPQYTPPLPLQDSSTPLPFFLEMPSFLRVPVWRGRCSKVRLAQEPGCPLRTRGKGGAGGNAGWGREGGICLLGWVFFFLCFLFLFVVFFLVVLHNLFFWLDGGRGEGGGGEWEFLVEYPDSVALSHAGVGRISVVESCFFWFVCLLLLFFLVFILLYFCGFFWGG